MLGTRVSAWREHRDYAPLDWVRHLESGDPRHQIYEDLTYGPLSQMPALRFWPRGKRLNPADIPPALQPQTVAPAVPWAATRPPRSPIKRYSPHFRLFTILT